MAPPKQQAPVAAKRKKYRPTLRTKLEIIRRLAEGEKAAHLGRLYKINESTIRTINKNAEKIKQSVAQATPLAAKVASRVRNPLLIKMEGVLASWISEQDESALTANIIRDKALSIYEMLHKESSEPPEKFLASKGWYENFRKRQRQLNFAESVVADPIATSAFLNELKSKMADEDYSPQQIFIIHQSSLLWKKMPQKLYASNTTPAYLDSKTAQDRISILLCNSSDGSFKCKPLLVYHIENPLALKGKSRHTLPVYWRIDKKAEITTQIFEDWFINCFCNELEKYCAKNNHDFRGLLLLDNELKHLSYLTDLKPNIKFLFLQSDITMAMKPVHEGILNIFTVSYLKSLFNQMHDSIGGNEDLEVKSFLLDYNILNAITNIVCVWDELKETSISGLWEAMCNDDAFYTGTVGFASFANVSADVNEIISIGRLIGRCGFEMLEQDDIINLLEENTKQCHAALCYEQVNEVGAGEEDEKAFTHVLSVEKLENLLHLAEQLNADAMQMDPNTERSVKFGKKLSEALSVYRDLYNVKKS